MWSLEGRVKDGVLSSALPIGEPCEFAELKIAEDPYKVTKSFNKGGKKSPFLSAGAMQDFKVVATDVEASFKGEVGKLSDVIVPEEDVPEEFYIDDDKLERWKYLKGIKSEERTNKQTGFAYRYPRGLYSFSGLV